MEEKYKAVAEQLSGMVESVAALESECGRAALHPDCQLVGALIVTKGALAAAAHVAGEAVRRAHEQAARREETAANFGGGE